MAANVAEYVECTIIVWFSGLYKVVPLDQVGGVLYCQLLSAGAEDHFNSTDRRLASKEDTYVQTSFDNMRKQNGGILPCLFLDVLASQIVSIALRIAVNPQTAATARQGYKNHIAFVQEQVRAEWNKGTFSAEMRALSQTCGDPASCGAHAGGKLIPGAKNRFAFKLQIETGETAVDQPHVATSLTFAKHRCGSCQKEGAKLKCSRCKRVYYCARECQKENWALHRELCCPEEPN